jgi:hypothetical protein
MASDANAAEDEQSEEDKRLALRVRLDLPIQARVGQGQHLDVEIVDISASGMQIRSTNFDVLKDGFDTQHNVADFEIRILARLAWARPEDDGSFVTGWEFNRDNGEELIG